MNIEVVKNVHLMDAADAAWAPVFMSAYQRFAKDRSRAERWHIQVEVAEHRGIWLGGDLSRKEQAEVRAEIRQIREGFLNAHVEAIPIYAGSNPFDLGSGQLEGWVVIGGGKPPAVVREPDEMEKEIAARKALTSEKTPADARSSQV